MSTVFESPQLTIYEEVARIRQTCARQDPWDVLRIPPESSYRQIKSAQRRWIRYLHPDRWHFSPDADFKADIEEAFYSVQEAYLEALKRRASALGPMVIPTPGPITTPPATVPKLAAADFLRRLLALLFGRTNVK